MSLPTQELSEPGVAGLFKRKKPVPFPADAEHNFSFFFFPLWGPFFSLRPLFQRVSGRRVPKSYVKKPAAFFSGEFPFLRVIGSPFRLPDLAAV